MELRIRKKYCLELWVPWPLSLTMTSRGGWVQKHSTDTLCFELTSSNICEHNCKHNPLAGSIHSCLWFQQSKARVRMHSQNKEGWFASYLHKQLLCLPKHGSPFLVFLPSLCHHFLMSLCMQTTIRLQILTYFFLLFTELWRRRLFNSTHNWKQGTPA